jgi:hypothetical protein
MTARAWTTAVASLAIALSGCGDDPPPRSQSSAATATPTATVPPEPQRPEGRFEKATCDERAYEATNPQTGWVHPSQNFYFPGEDTPSAKDIQHVLIKDNAVLVEYDPEIPDDAREALRGWSAYGTAVVTVPATAADPPRLRASTANRQLTCDGIDLEQLQAFADRRGTGTSAPHGESG